MTLQPILISIVPCVRALRRCHHLYWFHQRLLKLVEHIITYDYFRLEIYVDAEHDYYSSCGTILDKEPFVG